MNHDMSKTRRRRKQTPWLELTDSLECIHVFVRDTRQERNGK